VRHGTVRPTRRHGWLATTTRLLFPAATRIVLSQPVHAATAEEEEGGGLGRPLTVQGLGWSGQGLTNPFWSPTSHMHGW